MWVYGEVSRFTRYCVRTITLFVNGNSLGRRKNLERFTGYCIFLPFLSTYKILPKQSLSAADICEGRKLADGTFLKFCGSEVAPRFIVHPVHIPAHLGHVDHHDRQNDAVMCTVHGISGNSLVYGIGEKV